MKLNFWLSPSAKRRQNPRSGFPAVYRLEGLSVRRAKQKANLMYKCINNLAPAYLCNLFAPRTPNYYFRNAKKKINAPKTKNWLPEA